MIRDLFTRYPADCDVLHNDFWLVRESCSCSLIGQVLSTAADPHLGGATFDRLIADYFAEDFKARYRVDARSNPKVYLRLLGESERLKKLMSANSQVLSPCSELLFPCFCPFCFFLETHEC